jgi:hypothetical protein
LNQFEIKQWLEEHAGIFFTSSEIAQETGTDGRTIFSKMDAISKDKDIVTKTVYYGIKKVPTTAYCFVKKEQDINDVIADYTVLRNAKGVGTSYHSEMVTNFMVLKELRSIRLLLEELNNGNKERI